jgi:hypothetical protein
MEKTLTNLFCETSIILISKLNKDTTKKENNRPISLMKLDKNSSIKYWKTDLAYQKDHMDQVNFI